MNPHSLSKAPPPTRRSPRSGSSPLAPPAAAWPIPPPTRSSIRSLLRSSDRPFNRPPVHRSARESFCGSPPPSVNSPFSVWSPIGVCLGFLIAAHKTSNRSFHVLCILVRPSYVARPKRSIPVVAAEPSRDFRRRSQRDNHPSGPFADYSHSPASSKSDGWRLPRPGTRKRNSRRTNLSTNLK